MKKPGIPSPGDGIKQDLPREFLTQSDHLLKYYTLTLTLYRKLWSQRPNSDDIPVPPEFSQILESDHSTDFIENSKKSHFFQAQTVCFGNRFVQINSSKDTKASED